MQKIGLRIEPQNIASGGVAQKCGFTKTGFLRREFRAHDGRLMDVEWWEMLRDEFVH
jgi:RimJ/RimL family protein N-acetyltransferase